MGIWRTLDVEPSHRILLSPDIAKAQIVENLNLATGWYFNTSSYRGINMRSQPEPCGNTGNLRLHSALNYIIYPIKDSKSKLTDSCWGCCPVFTMQPSCWLQRARTNSFLHRSTQTLDLVNRWLKCSTKQMAASNKKAVKKMFPCSSFKQGKTRHPAHSLNHRK
jgi:hypothetical protein